MKKITVGDWNTRNMMTQKEVAETLGVHFRTVQRMIRRGDLKAVRIGRALYIGTDSIGR